MKPWAAPPERPVPAALTGKHAQDQLIALLPALGDARGAPEAVELFLLAIRLIGADAGIFLSLIREDAARSSYRSLLACDPLWAVEYVRHVDHEHDPWLQHALRSSEPIRSSELVVKPDEAQFVRAAAQRGFASALIVPAPTTAGTSRVGMLCLGSQDPHRFDGPDYPLTRIMAQALAMELHRWLLRALRDDLLSYSGLTAPEIELLRHEAAGHTSKMIGATLKIEPKTIDCRFQRLSAKLDAPDRRTAARIARLYGLL